ncbi:MAG: hypothetical protein LBS68_00275 [Puniceicoccales bacterium]|jgi:RNA polymerase sigma-54 factor|nr:hypothetical protein [Puniceicoccales bacterium]
MNLRPAVTARPSQRFSQRLRLSLRILALPRWKLGRFSREWAMAVGGEAAGSAADWLQEATTFSEELFRRMALDHTYGVAERRMLEGLVGNIGEWGYLESDLAAIASSAGVDGNTAEKIYRDLCRFEGRGLGCRHFREYLLWQASGTECGEILGCAAPILRGEKKITALIPVLRLLRRRLLREDFDAILRALADRRLRFHPPMEGLHWETEMAVGAPDLYINREGNDWTVSSVPTGEDLASWPSAAGKSWQPNFFRVALERRLTLLIRLGEVLLERQKSFFEEGPRAIGPFLQKELASALNLTPSTISRAIQNKYLRTPHGTFPCELFFCKSRGGSPILIAHGLREILRNDPGALLWTHGHWAEELNRRFSADISRKTIAIHRGKMLPF